MPRRSRSKGRHGVGSSSLSALKPMKQMWVSASTPPTSAVGVTPARTRSAPSAMEAAPEAQAMTTVSFGPVRPRRQPSVSACESGRIERSARMLPEGRPRISPQYQSSPSSMPPPTAPMSSADRCRCRPLEARVGQRLAGRGQREAVGARAAARDPERAHRLGGHLGGDARAEALGVDEGDGLDRAGAGGEAGPEALDPRAVGAHDAEPAHHDIGPATRGRPPGLPGRLIARPSASGPRAPALRPGRSSPG